MELAEIQKTIAVYCVGRPEIIACYLFGSYASGRQRPGSDADVTFLLDASVAQSQYFDLKLTYHNGLANLLRLDIHCFRQVDKSGSYAKECLNVPFSCGRLNYVGLV
ncbi:MAG: nucleotidyltransferase domain-containing protein [Geobacter sp.]|nr:nucleotidyltransferase domain-containing protein [Geobacter sp.]